MATQVNDIPDRSRYEIRVDGEVAGFSTYRDVRGTRVLTHTEVDSRFSGQGLGSTLVRSVLDGLRDEGRTVVPVCPFVAQVIDQNPEYRDLIDPELDARLRG